WVPVFAEVGVTIIRRPGVRILVTTLQEFLLAGAHRGTVRSRNLDQRDPCLRPDAIHPEVVIGARAGVHLVVLLFARRVQVLQVRHGPRWSRWSESINRPCRRDCLNCHVDGARPCYAVAGSAADMSRTGEVHRGHSSPKCIRARGHPIGQRSCPITGVRGRRIHHDVPAFGRVASGLYWRTGEEGRPHHDPQSNCTRPVERSDHRTSLTVAGGCYFEPDAAASFLIFATVGWSGGSAVAQRLTTALAHFR